MSEPSPDIPESRKALLMVGERKPDPVLDEWMRARGLLLDAETTCPRCHGRGWYWRIEGDPPARMFWHTCSHDGNCPEAPA